MKKMKIEPMVHLNTNPCKCGLPGVVTAFYGVKGSMSILHGSQGCSTYIRRHMATHYNEPIDIASSSDRRRELSLEVKKSSGRSEKYD